MSARTTATRVPEALTRDERHRHTGAVSAPAREQLPATSPAPPDPRRLVVFDLCLTVLALVVIAAGFVEWGVSSPPDWQPVAVLGLLAVPVLTRYSVTVSR